MKIALIGDTHWGIKNDHKSFYEYFEKCYDWMFDVLDSEHVDAVIQLGDLYDRRKYVNFKTLFESKKIFLDRLNQYDTLIISGNHDCTYKNTNEVNSVDLLLKEYPNIKVIDRYPETVYINGYPIDAYPWISNENYSNCMSLAESPGSNIAVGHFEFINFEMAKGQFCDHGMDHKIFSKYTKVFSGHYHTKSEFENVVYTGVPYELMWSDYNDPKGIVIFDTETMKYEFIQNPHRKFFKIYYDDTLRKDEQMDIRIFDHMNKQIAHDLIKGSYTKVIVVNKKDIYYYEKYIDYILTLGAEDVKIVEESIQNSIDSVVEEKLDFEDTPTLMESFVDSMVDLNSLDPSKLKSLLKSLYIEAYNS